MARHKRARSIDLLKSPLTAEVSFKRLCLSTKSGDFRKNSIFPEDLKIDASHLSFSEPAPQVATAATLTSKQSNISPYTPVATTASDNGFHSSKLHPHVSTQLNAIASVFPNQEVSPFINTNLGPGFVGTFMYASVGPAFIEELHAKNPHLKSIEIWVVPSNVASDLELFKHSVPLARLVNPDVD